MGIIRFRVHDTTVNPVGAATALVTDGIFAHTRNPLYLGALIGFLGLGLALRSTWLLLSVMPLAVALQGLAIEPEEAHLGRRFGAAYRAYCQRTRRWI